MEGAAVGHGKVETAVVAFRLVRSGVTGQPSHVAERFRGQ